jgi:hypothetical protein
MTPEDWKYIERRLNAPCNFVKLSCDGYDVTLMVLPVKDLRNGIFVWVNGIRRGKWLFEECEESRRFLRRVEKPYYKPEEQKLEKRLAKILKRPSNHDKKFVYWRDYWTNVTALRRHFTRNNQDIQLVREGI